MNEDSANERERRIFAAAYELLAERGYGGTSMLTVARRAKVSNETLYRRYGDKRGLFARMVEENARETRSTLEEAITAGGDPLASLAAIAPVLLAMLLGERAVMLNQAAAADGTGELGGAIARGGREAVAPLIAALLGRAIDERGIDAPSGRVAAEWFLALLIGDLQVRRVNRTLPEPREDEIATRVEGALSAFMRLCAT